MFCENDNISQTSYFVRDLVTVIIINGLVVLRSQMYNYNAVKDLFIAKL